MVTMISEVAIIGILAIIHIIAIVYTWKVGKSFNSRSWVVIILAFVLLLFRRIMNFLDAFEIISYSDGLITIIDQVYLPLVVWVLISLGMIKIYYNIRASMHLEKKLKNVEKKKSSKKKKRKK